MNGKIQTINIINDTLRVDIDLAAFAARIGGIIIVRQNKYSQRIILELHPREIEPLIASLVNAANSAAEQVTAPPEEDKT